MRKRDEFYRSYVTFKSWHDFEGAPDDTFEVEMKRAGVMPPAKILEIGFGQGHFLNWATLQGFTVTGVELIEELTARARSRGLRVFHGHVQQISELTREKFDLVVAFDVFEHLTLEELVDLLRFLVRILEPSGKVLARFPNAGSPFGMPYQYGDVTHVTPLSAATISQIAIAAGMGVVWADNAARSLKSGHHHWIAKKMAYFVRDAIERIVGQIYFGGRMPLDPNLTALLQPVSRADQTTHSGSGA